ncbi:transmembrane emp24 domain-containing protein p24delta9-like [Vitis riparia]|uniref:transmembrane emp24 domain-containing protein p24delta9-like n=1 Tax=Vitis riparia TaxID=96939 RepID=UPI00155A21AE|nr:transmembrane emp24 domain-containing protein p24delta9-like [Vitis riparia]
MNEGAKLLQGVIEEEAATNAVPESEKDGTQRFLKEEKDNAMSVGQYSIINPNEGFPLPDTHKITAQVSSPYGNNYHPGDHTESGNFAFTAAEEGDYTACFWAPQYKPPLTVTIVFDWRTGVAAKDWSKVAKKGQVEVMELELKNPELLNWPGKW